VWSFAASLTHLNGNVLTHIAISSFLLNISSNVRFEIFMAVTMKTAVFWGVTLCGSCKNRSFGGTSVFTKATQRNIPEDGILQQFK
jgi:hypothetical protein